MEAEVVVDAVMEHARKNPGQTLGVVAFSTAQMQAIQEALETEAQEIPGNRNFFP